jgi:hypothetical protein
MRYYFFCAVILCLMAAHALPMLFTGESFKPHDRVPVEVYYKFVPAISPISP